MKRKLLLIILSFSLFFIFGVKINANASAGSNYMKFSSITISKGKLLKNYSSSELNYNIKKCCKKRFLGWSIGYLNYKVKCNFVSETILSIYNTGTTPIKYKVSEIQTKMYKTSISSTGSIGTQVKGDIKKFKGDLSSSLKITGEYTQTVEIKNTETLEIDVDPKTRVTMYLAGTGYLTTGVARKTFFWITTAQGGFEYFQVTDCYPKIVKVAL